MMPALLEAAPGVEASPGGAAAIEARGLVKSFGPVAAVQGVDLRVNYGQIYALLGPNGAGKTTTINILTTLIRADKGLACVAGYDVALEPGQVRRVIGVTFQETVMDKNLSGRGLLDIHGRLYRMPGKTIKSRTAELARLVELEDALDRPVKTYSGGMKRRLELARGLLTNPRVLFLDEPTLGLDPHNRENIWAYIRRLRAETGLTILFTTHYMDEAAELADRVGIIDQGRLVCEGTPRGLIEEMGSDVITLSGTGQAGAFLSVLEAQEWVAFARQEGGHPAPLEAGTGETQVQIGLKVAAGSVLKTVIDLAGQHGFVPGNVNIERPSLSQVFFKYTGRRLRD